MESSQERDEDELWVDTHITGGFAIEGCVKVKERWLSIRVLVMYDFPPGSVADLSMGMEERAVMGQIQSVIGFLRRGVT